jgi:hypothetical protein
VPGLALGAFEAHFSNPVVSDEENGGQKGGVSHAANYCLMAAARFTFLLESVIGIAVFCHFLTYFLMMESPMDEKN